ncbi:hypothetical protein J4E85_002936 [Alternaria conjuncta]|uniref:uncharacterized protein n=1 Tax=Alternaria conjuncta TaxID=181017 RepID=UPI0022203D75|nr:uncharacterized protein J4E85_002936 [Alternaria conjuncta]KAI4932538.1 hypothetical protein J4E85_002936 [Alternaria conjuncta]
MPDPVLITLPTAPTWSPVIRRDAPNVRASPIIGQEQERNRIITEAIGIPESGSLKRIAEHSINVLSLDTKDRKVFLEGPTVDLIARGIVIRKDVALRALIASCQKANDAVQITPQITRFRIHGHADEGSIKRLLDVFTTSKLLGLDRVDLVSVLGIHYTHSAPLLGTLRALVSSRLLSISELEMLVRRFPPTNPLFKHTAKELCRRRFKKQIPNIAEFENWLNKESQEGLKKTMAACDKVHKMTRQAITRRKCDWRKDAVLRLWGEDVDGVCVEEEAEDDMEPDKIKRRDSKLLE